WLVDRARRRLITCYHVAGENPTLEVFFPIRVDGVLVADRQHYLGQRDQLRRSGHCTTGRVLLRRPDVDLALVELEALPPEAGGLPLAAGRPWPGDLVHVIGCRYDVEALWAYGHGEVRQVLPWRDGYAHGGKQLARGALMVMASPPINEGDSGGP